MIPREEFWTFFAGTPFEMERSRIESGEPWLLSEAAGLQFYDYDKRDGLGGRVRPPMGDRVSLVRRPDNRRDRNAIEIWWHNQYMIGHLPRAIAAQLAPRMDAGEALRAYVSEEGTGRAWSLEVVLVGGALVERPDPMLETGDYGIPF